jgi:hypothetical protein
MTRTILPLAVLLVCALGPSLVLASMECDAELSPELSREESGYETGGVGERYTFHIEVSTEADCAKIRFELIATVQTSDGQEETRRKPAQLRLSDGSTGYRMTFNLRAGEELENWEFVLTDCQACTLLAPE